MCLLWCQGRIPSTNLLASYKYRIKFLPSLCRCSWQILDSQWTKLSWMSAELLGCQSLMHHSLSYSPFCSCLQFSHSTSFWISAGSCIYGDSRFKPAEEILESNSMSAKCPSKSCPLLQHTHAFFHWSKKPCCVLCDPLYPASK